MQGDADPGIAFDAAQDPPRAPVFSKSLEAARFEWLTSRSSSTDSGAADLRLLRRAQRHLSMQHRISEALVSTRDLDGVAERLLLETIRAIAATIDAKDGYTHRHSERVAALSRRIALEIGLSADEQQTVQLAALLHDVGKIAVPDSILNKPGRLTAAEFEEIKKHPVHGAQILANIESPAVAAVLPGVRHHHERWDGLGYPHRLREMQIPLLGRLLGVADFYDAVTSARAYRPAIPQEEAVAMIADGAGSHFDPAIVDAVLRLHRRGELLPSNREALPPTRDYGRPLITPT
jgi:putative nucleotidyltransferase with HDIG domain